MSHERMMELRRSAVQQLLFERERELFGRLTTRAEGRLRRYHLPLPSGAKVAEIESQRNDNWEGWK